MKFRLFIYILLLPFLSALLISCCDCEETFEGYFTHQEISLQHLDNSGAEPVVTYESALKTAYGIRLEIQREQIASLNLSKFILMQSATAFTCDCDKNYYLPKETITSIKIITLNDFDENHLAGSDISDYFKVYEFNNYKPISEYIENLNKNISSQSYFESQDDFLLMNPPTINTQHVFKIEIILSDERVLEYETSTINLI